MPTPNADGPDIARRYQDIVGPCDPAWSIFSVKWCEGQRSQHPKWRETWAWMREQPGLRYRGGYHWVRSDSTPKAQADFAISLMREVDFGQPGDIWQTDWETTPGIPLITSTQVAEYNDRIRQAFGRDVIITYSSDWLPDGEFYKWRDANPDDALWYANYNIGTRPTGGWAEIDKYDADVWQWTSSYRHPSIISYSGGGFDMNHIRRTDRLDVIAGYQTTTTPTPPEDDDMPRRIIYVLPPAERQDAPHFLAIDGSWRYAVGGDKAWCEANGGTVVTETAERYDLIHASVFPEPAQVVIPPIEVPEFPSSWSITAG